MEPPRDGATDPRVADGAQRAIVDPRRDGEEVMTPNGGSAEATVEDGITGKLLVAGASGSVVIVSGARITRGSEGRGQHLLGFVIFATRTSRGRSDINSISRRTTSLALSPVARSQALNMHWRRTSFIMLRAPMERVS